MLDCIILFCYDKFYFEVIFIGIGIGEGNEDNCI